MNDKIIMSIILGELEMAEALHPYWPNDIIHGVSIMNEEAGEAIRAALNFQYQNEPIEEIEKELIQTAAMCIRNPKYLYGLKK